MKKNILFAVIMAGAGFFLLTGCAETNTSNNLQISEATPFTFKSTEEAALPSPPPTVSSRHVTLTNLNLDNKGSQIIIKPGQSIQARLDYAYHCKNCNPARGNQIIIGLAHRSAQVCIYDGGAEAQGSANFELKVPVKPGKYEIRYLAMQAADCNEALKTGWGTDNSPSKETTIGKIIASKRAEISASS